MHLAHLFKQKGYEQVVYLLRRHPVVLLGHVVVFAVLATLPIGVIFMLQRVVPTLLSSDITFPIVAVVGSIYYLAIWLFFFTAILNYYLEVWIVTNDRILSIDQDGLFSRTMSEVELWRIQDVTSEVKGALPTMLNYGRVYIQTAAERERFVFEQVPNPSVIRQKIIDLAEVDRRYHATMTEEKMSGS